MGFTKKEANQFISTSKTANIPNRLQKRFRAIFETEPGIWKDKRVLDLGSHDGRFSYAALKMGAAHVTGIEARNHLVENSLVNMANLKVPAANFTFLQQDAIQFMAETNEQFDIVLCLGFMYHTFDHVRLMNLMKRVAKDFIVIDTVVNLGDRMTCIIKKEPIRLESNSVRGDKTTPEGFTYVAVPSVPFLQELAKDIGFSFKKVNWKPIAADNPRGIPDYILRRRATIFCQRIPAI